uniref:Reverse transcriptase domain-containing protein n=1 Tax=Tanacetum cinerariifolium TaxID=118510 RepID=A0A6L2KS07_TANCI|nr:reverse transcriptase domain-containing protein [Tanacetum cinerariifolium]
MPREYLAIIESKSKVRYSRNKLVVAKVSTNTSSGISPDVAELKDMNVQLNQRNNQNRFNQNQNWGNNFNHGHVYQPPVFQPPAYQAPAYQAPAPQTEGVLKDDFSAYVKANDAVMRNMQTQGQNMQNQFTNLTDLLTKPQILPPPSFLPTVVENELEATKDTVHPTNNGSTEDIQPLVVQSKSPILTSEPVNSPISKPVISLVSAPRPNQRPSIPYPSRMQDQKIPDKTMTNLNNRDKLCELARTPLNEHCSAVLLKKLPEKLGDLDKFLIPCDFPEKAECLALADLSTSINLMPLSVWNKLSLPYLTPMCMNLELVDHSISCLVRVAEDVYVKVEAFLNDEPSLPPPNQGNYLPEVRKELKICEAKSDKSSIDEPPEVELKDLPPHLEYAFLEGGDKLPVIIAKDLSEEEKTALITVLKSHKRAIAWKLSDIKGIDPEFCTHKILMKEDFEPAVQHQRRVNPKIHDVIKQEVLKLLDAGLIYLIFDSPWVSLVH